MKSPEQPSSPVPIRWARHHPFTLAGCTLIALVVGYLAVSELALAAGYLAVSRFLPWYSSGLASEQAGAR